MRQISKSDRLLGLALGRATGFRLLLPNTGAFLGSAYLWSSRTADAVPLLKEAVEAITAMGMLGRRSWFIPFLAEGYLVLGQVAEAREQAEQAVALARAHHERGWEAWGLKLLGDVDAREPAESEQAADAYRRALALATELGLRPLTAHCHFGLAKLYRQTSKREKARQHFTTAITMYRDMDMQFWLERAEVDMRGLA